MIERFPPKAAAVPVLETNPDITPTITIIATIKILSPFANFVTRPPILFTIPVSNNATSSFKCGLRRIWFRTSL